MMTMNRCPTDFISDIVKQKTKCACEWRLSDFPHTETQYRITYGWIKLYGFFFRVSLIRLDWTTYSEKKENVFFNWIYRFRRFALSLSRSLFVSVYVRSMSSRNSLYIFDKCSSHEISMFYSNWAYFLAVRFLWFLINFLFCFSFYLRTNFNRLQSEWEMWWFDLYYSIFFYIFVFGNKKN